MGLSHMNRIEGEKNIARQCFIKQTALEQYEHVLPWIHDALQGVNLVGLPTETKYALVWSHAKNALSEAGLEHPEGLTRPITMLYCLVYGWVPPEEIGITL